MLRARIGRFFSWPNRLLQLLQCNIFSRRPLLVSSLLLNPIFRDIDGRLADLEPLQPRRRADFSAAAPSTSS